jgi:hypothetical protein
MNIYKAPGQHLSQPLAVARHNDTTTVMTNWQLGWQVSTTFSNRHVTNGKQRHCLLGNTVHTHTHFNTMWRSACQIGLLNIGKAPWSVQHLSQHMAQRCYECSNLLAARTGSFHTPPAKRDVHKWQAKALSYRQHKSTSFLSKIRSHLPTARLHSGSVR